MHFGYRTSISGKNLRVLYSNFTVYRLYSAFVCLSVCLLAISRKNFSSDLHENFTRDVSIDSEELISSWKSLASRSRSANFLKNSSTLRSTAIFYNLAHVSGKKAIGSSWKLYQRYTVGQGYPLNRDFIQSRSSDLDSMIRTQNQDRSVLTEAHAGDWNLQDWKSAGKIAGMDIAGLEIDGLEFDGLEFDGLEIAELDSRRSNDRIQECNF